MVLAVAIASRLDDVGANGGVGIPGRLQSLAEMAYEFRRRHGALGGRRARDGVLSLRVLPVHVHSDLQPRRPRAARLHRHQPYHHHGFAGGCWFSHRHRRRRQRDGLHFFKLFVPSGVPIYILPLVVLIEIISFLSRPLSHSVRLFANMLAGHIRSTCSALLLMLLSAGFLTNSSPCCRSNDDRP